MRFTIQLSGKPPAAAAAPARQALKAALASLPPSLVKRKLRGRAQPLTVILHFVNARNIQSLNRQYRGKNRPTDVLSFSNLESPPLPGISQPLGEIVLCWTVIREQAKRFRVTAREELQRMVIHGCLHLWGYDHEQDAREAKRMFALQERILKLVSVD